MEHFNKDFTGWFTYNKFYEQLAKDLPNNCVFAEIGCWVGRAVSFLAVELINQNKNPTILCIDTWRGSPEHFAEKEILNNTLIEDFYNNTKPVREYLIPMCGGSVEMAGLVADNSLDGAFIDAEHTYESVKADIMAWLPKIKTGGILAGHDYFWNTGELVVKKAVDEVLGFNNLVIKENDNCWVYHKV